MNWLQGAILAMVALGGLAVVLTRDPLHQAIVASFYGILLALMFFVFQAPDVALSQIAIGALALPLMILLALAKIRRTGRARSRAGAGYDGFASNDAVSGVLRHVRRHLRGRPPACTRWGTPMPSPPVTGTPSMPWPDRNATSPTPSPR